MRTAHSRFLNKQPVGKRDEFDRVVTSVWSLDKNTNVLTYGAVVYFKNGPNDHWGKRRHYLKAVERFHKNPVRVSLQYVGFFNQTLSSMANLSMDWYIATNLIFKFGTHDKTGVVPPVGFHGISTIYDDFNEAYCKLSHRYEDSSESSDEEDNEEEQSELISNYSHAAFYMLAGFTLSSLSTFVYLRFIGL